MNTAIIVPGRLASTRFPGKLLHPVKGVPLIVQTARRIRAQVPEYPLYFAVDHVDLQRVLEDDGFSAIVTVGDHASGTDRIAEANRIVRADPVINVQADEPLVSRAQILQLSELIRRDGVSLATLAHPFERPEDFANPNQVKVVLNLDGEALYFSRARIPFNRDTGGVFSAEWHGTNPCYRHLGLYAYRSAFLEAFTLMQPALIERLERLEQLRALENGHRIAVGITHERTIGVDDPTDLPLLIQAMDRESQ